MLYAKIATMTNNRSNKKVTLKAISVESDQQRFMQSERFQMIARIRSRKSAFCPVCDRPVPLVSDSAAEGLFKVEIDDLMKLAAMGRLHRLHNIRGRLMFCGDSLFECFNEQDTMPLNSPAAQAFYREASARQ